MATRASLKAILEALDFQPQESTTYFNQITGEIVSVTDDEMATAEAGEDEDLSDYSDWERESIEKAREIAESDDFLALPDSFEINEYAIMEWFCLDRDDADQRDRLLDAIRGSGAFRRFKNAVERMGIADEWYRYRDAAMRDKAIAWCEENGLEYEE